MTTRNRLLGRAQIDGEARDSGYIFTLEDGEKGPMRTVGMNGPNPRDEKLYEEVDEEALAAAEERAREANAKAEGGDVAPADAPRDELTDPPKPDGEYDGALFVSEQEAGGKPAGDGIVKTPVFVSENDSAADGAVRVSEKDGDK